MLSANFLIALLGAKIFQPPREAVFINRGNHFTYAEIFSLKKSGSYVLIPKLIKSIKIAGNGHDGRFGNFAAVSPDGKFIAVPTTNYSGQTIHLYSRSGKKVGAFRSEDIFQMEWNSKSNLLAVLSWNSEKEKAEIVIYSSNGTVKSLGLSDTYRMFWDRRGESVLTACIRSQSGNVNVMAYKRRSDDSIIRPGESVVINAIDCVSGESKEISLLQSGSMILGTNVRSKEVNAKLAQIWSPGVRSKLWSSPNGVIALDVSDYFALGVIDKLSDAGEDRIYTNAGVQVVRRTAQDDRGHIFACALANNVVAYASLSLLFDKRSKFFNKRPDSDIGGLEITQVLPGTAKQKVWVVKELLTVEAYLIW